MAKSNLVSFDEHAPVLRFEESDDFQTFHTKAGNYAASAPSPGVGVSEDPFSELKEKQESLLRIRQELEKTQREAQDLEVRKNKENRFNTGRRDISEKVARSLGRLERDLYNAQKAIEEISVARETLQHHLDGLRSIQPEAWKRVHLDEELDRAITAVEDAENDFAKTSRRLSTVLPDHGHGSGHSATSLSGLTHDFATWLRLGLAFTLPLIVTTLVVVVLVKFFN